MKKMWGKIAGLALAHLMLMESSTNLAYGAPPSNSQNEKNMEAGEEEEEEEEEEEDPTVVLEVPVAVARKSLILRLDGMDYKLTSKKIRVPAGLSPQSIDIRDRSGRIVTLANKRVEKSMLKGEYIRNHSISLNMGESYSPSNRWKEILFDQTRLQYSMEYEYQPRHFGILIGYMRLANEESMTSGIRSTYFSDQLRVSLRWIFAPFTSSDSTFRSLHFGLYGGGFSASHKIEYQDFHSSLQIESSNFGVIGGYDISHPLGGNVWLQLRGDLTAQNLNFKEVGFRHTEIQQGYVLGVKYAF